jgi:hypothetical protein
MNRTAEIAISRLSAVFLSIGIAMFCLTRHQDARAEISQVDITRSNKSSCVDLRPRPDWYVSTSVDKPGNYCIAVDFIQHRWSSAGHSGPKPHEFIISIEGGDVVIDLKNHVLRSDGDSRGIIAYGLSDEEDATWLHKKLSRRSRNVIIKNGTIDLRGVGTAISFINGSEFYHLNDPVPEDLLHDEQTHYVLENLHIKTDNVGLKLSGSGNIIRNCVIESGGYAAIIMLGSNGQILNNKIILNNPFIPAQIRNLSLIEVGVKRFLEERRAPKAAIALRNAPGTLIKGNYIDVTGLSESRFNIYLSDGSRNVKIEDNIFAGKGSPATLRDTSTAEIKNSHSQGKNTRW